ncbi:MAG TPA: hypothetical protein VMR74_06790 [Gammaproteobacteria bacterium]|nr:hypothetical protein [Gammaproteobacteria bacterium]
MKTLPRVCQLTFASAAMTGCLIATAFAQNDDIIGTWTCDLTVDDPESGAQMNAEFEHTYDGDGTYERAGEMNIVIEAFDVDIAIGIEESGTWRWVESMVVGETTTDIEFSSAVETPSQMEQMMLQQMQAAADAESSEEQTVDISSLTATTMEIEDDDGAVMVCAKA